MEPMAAIYFTIFLIFFYKPINIISLKEKKKKDINGRNVQMLNGPGKPVIRSKPDRPNLELARTAPNLAHNHS